MLVLPIKKSREFKEISLKGKKFSSHTIILLTQVTPKIYFQDFKSNKNAKDFCRVGYTVSKAVGNAVERNLAKRRLRHLFKDLFLKYAKNHFDYVVIARREITKVDFGKIKTDFEFCLKKIHDSKAQSK